ncbi:hypothetical protein CYMTET_38207 [Cymbomonas tetramitiformis]|uniref:Uncharacterized protein n=1 Tax=Cymbomonas tetramitiformis TaxID=36881 RepID=A0AAE0CCD4_9CHLO|nr:hypothetical protein CYMTET_38207 [Cymbomonas tetramitiformis]
MVMEMRLSCNLSSQTIEQIIGKRKDAVLHLCKDELEDVRHQKKKCSLAHKGITTTHVDVQPLVDARDEIEKEKAAVFNESQCFLDIVGRVLDARDSVLSQLACLAGAAAFEAAAQGNCEELKRLVPVYTEDLKDGDGNTLLTFAIAQLKRDAAPCAKMVKAIMSLPAFVITGNGYCKDGKPPYLLAAELGLSEVLHAIISKCGTIDVRSHELPAATAGVLAAAVVASRAQMKSVNGLPLDELRSTAWSGRVLSLSEQLTADGTGVGAWTLGLLLSKDESYLTMQSVILDKKIGSISADEIRGLAGLTEYPAPLVKRWQNTHGQVAFICGLLGGSSSCTALNRSGGIVLSFCWNF